MTSRDDRVARGLLLGGAVAGVLLAAIGILRSGSSAFRDPAGAIAVVNGQGISREAFARFTGAVAAERKLLSLDPAERRRLLERTIDEELLFQRGVELELQRHESTARRAIVAAVIASVTADAEVGEPSEADLQAFYTDNRALFTRSPRLELDVVRIATGNEPDALSHRRAEEVVERARGGEDFDLLRDELGSAMMAPLPGGSLRSETIRQYLGPTAARVASKLAVGEVSEPVRGAAGYFVLWLRRRDPGEVAPLDQVRDQVRTEVLRRRGDDALRGYLSELRSAAEVRILEPELALP